MTADPAGIDQLDEARTLLTMLYGETAPGFLTVWRRQDRRTLWVPARDLDRAARLAVSHASSMDVYVGMGLRRAARASYERGTLEDVIGIPGLWDDVDLLGPAHAKQHLPATREEALGLLDEFPLVPTLIVDSGWGLQPHWLFDRPWIFADEREREAGGALVRRFQDCLHTRAAARGWTLDSTHDLTRVLRLPGTLNHKLTPVPVRMLAMHPNRRYDPSDFEVHLPPHVGARAADRRTQPVILPTDLPAVGLNALAISAWTRELIRRGRGAAPELYPSRSEAGWRVLLDLIEAGSDDAEIAAIFADPANAVGEKARERGQRWLAGEIARARRAAEHAPRPRRPPFGTSRRARRFRSRPHRFRRVGGGGAHHRGGGVMPAFEALRTRSGWQVLADSLTVEATGPRIDRGAIRVALTVVRDGVIVHRDTVNLTSARARANLIRAAAERELVLDERALIALDEACRSGAGSSRSRRASTPVPVSTRRSCASRWPRSAVSGTCSKIGCGHYVQLQPCCPTGSTSNS